MSCAEQALSFSCGDSVLLGVLATPADTIADTAVLIVVGGPQYRVGSHRQFVLLSRSLAAAGFPVLRFDHRGMGDSGGEPRGFDDVNDDIAAAIDAMQLRLPQVRQVVLWGLCDGASAALLYCHERQDRRVSGLCLLNPWVRSEAGLASTHVRHYYTRRVLQREFWAKLLRGGVAWAALGGFARSLRLALSGGRRPASAAQTFQQRMGCGWRRFDGKILLLLSGDDLTAKEFAAHAAGDAAWAGAFERPRVSRRELPGADHTFSDANTRRAVEELTAQWLRMGASPTLA